MYAVSLIGDDVAKRVYTPEQRERKRAYDKARHVALREKKCRASREWYEANRESGKARSAARYAEKRDDILTQERAKRVANPEKYATKSREAARKFRAENRELHNKRTADANKARRAANSEAERAKARERYWANPEKARTRAVADANLRRSRLLNATGEFTAQDVSWLYLRQHGKCAFCLKTLGRTDTEVDHYIPLSRGGANDRKNLRLLHALCNQRKHAKHPVDFGLENGLLAW